LNGIGFENVRKAQALIELRISSRPKLICIRFYDFQILAPGRFAKVRQEQMAWIFPKSRGMHQISGQEVAK
jgi:hypothetical protein